MLRQILISCALIIVLLQYIKAAEEEDCEREYISCDDGKCVLKEQWCDSYKNCTDGSDEEYCNKFSKWWGNTNECSDKHFVCKDGPCWPKSIRCDGTKDCKDGSDEKDCEEKSDESTEENDSDETVKEISTTTETPTSSESWGDYDEEFEKKDDYNEYEESTTVISTETTTQTETPTTEIHVSKFSVTPESALYSQTSEMDYYARRMEKTEANNKPYVPVSPTTVYRPSHVRHADINPTNKRPFVNTPSTRNYKHKRYTVSPFYRPRYSANKDTYPNGQRFNHNLNKAVYNPSNNVIRSYPTAYDRQNYRHPNGNNFRTDWRNNINHSPTIYRSRLIAPSPFFFKNNYAQMYGQDNFWSVLKATQWILSIRNASGGWGKETPRALVALSLANNSFLAGKNDNDLMQKYFQVHLGVNLLSGTPLNLNRLAMFVNALIATCQNPRDFHGQDLTELIRNTILELNRRSRSPFVNPIVYLSLCLADRNLTHFEVHHLMTYLVATTDDEITRDMTSLALVAFACHLQKESNSDQYQAWHKIVYNATSKILSRMKEDGSFGSIYSTALAAQALMSFNETGQWNPEQTFQFLKSHQLSNGSFGDFLATYHAIPALSGRNLMYLRNTQCNPPKEDRDLSPIEILEYPGPKQFVRYSLYFGSPLTTVFTIDMLVPKGISFFEIMKVAENLNSHFKFSYEEENGKINVYSISDIPNDSEKGFGWRLYVKSNPHVDRNTPHVQESYTGDLREFLVTADQDVMFWYHPI